MQATQFADPEEGIAALPPAPPAAARGSAWTAHRPWLAAYPPGVPIDIDPSDCASLVELMEESFRRYADRPAYAFMGREFTYAQTGRLAHALAAWLQDQGLARGDRVAVMLPNTPQYPTRSRRS
jgi:long-chain acyl-CoA synthetase